MGVILEPEVAAGLGDKTDLDATSHPPQIRTLHCEFAGWLGDDIVETFPCFLVTERLRVAIEANEFIGCSFDELLVTTSIEFGEMYPSVELPRFYWMKVNGKPFSDDFWLVTDHRLAVSRRAWMCLQQFNVEHCDVEFLDSAE